MDLRFRTDVDAPGRLIEYEHTGRGDEPFCEKHLLLVPAGESARELFDPGRNDPHAFREIVRDPGLAVAVHDPEHPGELSQDRQGRVRPDRELEYQSLLVPILGQEGDSVRHRPRG